MSDAGENRLIQLNLDQGAGPYLLPKCTASNLRIVNSDSAELALTTASGQQILIPVNSKVVEALHELMGIALNRGAFRR
jgi:hypothetical protein